MPSATFTNLPEDKKRRVLDAATLEFGARGLAEARLSEIVQSARIARGSIYQYFPSKEDLYIHLFETLRDERARFVEPAFELYCKSPFLDFFEVFYLRDSEYLLTHPSHLELGKHLYTSNDPTSRALIQQYRQKYHDSFLIGIEFDKRLGLVRGDVDSAALTDLCVHFVTDIFIFQALHEQLSIRNIGEHWRKTRTILTYGITQPCCNIA
ncbi:AcrR family transcriptional regulator [Clostridia bacterium]|nr:AcrR family transcriptional regulator [Clostridia bacterium]